MKANESMENYLEHILMLGQKLASVRSVDLAAELGVTKPSVSHATKLMRENGWITVDPDGGLSLTESGAAIAGRMYERHRVIAGMLMSIGVSEQAAFADACKIEHDLSDESFEALRRHIGDARK